MATAIAGDDEDEDEGFSLAEEIEMLEAIYIHELNIVGQRERPSSVCLLLHPSTGEEDDKQYVCLTLEIFLPKKYPFELPSIEISNPRGLSEAHVQSISDNLHGLTESLQGSAMLYQIIDYAKESLTDNNIPSCTCAICLDHFQDHDCFTKTDCYHYFHCHCLLRYIEHYLNNCQDDDTQQDDDKIICPMCRLPITYDIDTLRSAPGACPQDEQIVYRADAKMKKLQKEMSKLYNQQLKRGGIINTEKEKNKTVITLSLETNDDNSSSTSADKPTKDVITNCTTKDSNNVSKDSSSQRQGKPRFDRPYSSRTNRGRGRGNFYRQRGRHDEKDYGQSKQFERKPTKGERTKELKNGARAPEQAVYKKEIMDNESKSDPRFVRHDKQMNSLIGKGSSSQTTTEESRKKSDNNITERIKQPIVNHIDRTRYKGGEKREGMTGRVASRPSSGDNDKSSDKNSAGETQRKCDKTKTPRSKRDYHKNKEKTIVINKSISQHSDKKREHSSGVSQPPPGFESLRENTGGRRPPPGFEDKASMPKPPGV